MRHCTAILVMGIFAFMVAPAWASDRLDIAGVWLTENGQAHVEISDCGDGTPCGTMVWVQPPEGEETALDGNNPDETLRQRPLVGLQMLWGFEAKRDKWKNGRIYNAEDGKTYKSHVQLVENGTLKVEGCILFLCQKQIWTKVEPDLASN